MKAPIFKYTLAFFILIELFSCVKQNSEVRVGFLMEKFTADRWALDKKFFEEKVTELGAKVITKISDGSDANQFAVALELINERVDILVVVASNVNSAAAIVREAHKAGIKVIAYDRFIRNSDLDYFVGLNAVQIGELQAEYALSKIPKGNFVLLEGDKSDMNAVNIESGQMNVLNPKIQSGEVNIIYRVFVDNWSSVEAGYEIEKVLKLSDKQIDVILSANDGNAMGARNAIEKLGVEDNILITGLDADLNACQRIIKDKQTMTVYTPIIECAKTAAELAVKVAKKRP
ncbi:MAG: sugar ABC transporter substrate-binding protein [Chloroflexia bacterium]|nr:sugar ABC transporter substrate-binding protein [Chloroflexia bacterium]